MELTATTFITIDGVMQSPGAPEEDRSGGFDLGGWVIPYADDSMGSFIADVFARADAFLLGRRTYEIFARHWPGVADENPVAAALNRLPKHVASTTLKAADWEGEELIDGDLVAAVEELKRSPGRELQVHGSGDLLHTLMGAGLIDRHRLLVFPVALGTGATLFVDRDAASAYELESSETTDAGVLLLTYRPAGKPRQGSFADAPEPQEVRLLR
jgi:dihydrofolate reductase